MPRQHIFYFHRQTIGAGFFHRLHQRDGHDAFAHIGLRRFARREAARKLFDVILIFARVVRVAAETEKIIILIFERLDD